MRLLSVVLSAIAVLATTASVNADVDDSTCKFKLLQWSCLPKSLCSYQYKFGDLTPSQSCRVRKGAYRIPQQMHLAYAGAEPGTGMTLSWATFDKVSDSAIWIGDSESSLKLRKDVFVSSESYYSDGKYELYQHHGTVSGLKPATTYYYRVGSANDEDLRGDVGTFKTAPGAGSSGPYDYLIFGDLGFGKNGEQTMDLLTSRGEQWDMVYHLGDISYADTDFLDPSKALGFFYEEVYNEWMNDLSPVMEKIPYMVMVGNHEAECHSPACLVSRYKKDRLSNYTAYNARFKMPSKESNGVKNMWYSFDHGPVHFTTISSETDYPDAPSNAYTLTHKNGNFGNQLKWLEEDLKKATANRESVPWIVVGMHRPMYDIAGSKPSGEPKGQPKAIQSAFEELFLKYGVDVVMSGHQHSYERQTPVAHGERVMDGVSSDYKTYTNPKAPVHIVSGGAGNNEPNHPPIAILKRPWNVMWSAEYGVSTLKASRESLDFKYITSAGQQVVDEFSIVKK